MNDFVPVHHELVIRLEEQLMHQQAEIQSLSKELFAQQKDIQSLSLHIKRLEQKISILDAASPVRSIEEETPPPHY